MRPVDIAPIECRAEDGALVATVVISHDMAEEKAPGLAPIAEVPEEETEEFAETRFQLRENGRYYYDIELAKGEKRDLRLRAGNLAGRRPRLKPGQPDSGRIDTASFCGTLFLELVEDDADDLERDAVASATIDVRSLKLRYRSEYRGMLTAC